MKTLTLLAAFATVTTGLCGELVIKGNKELLAINPWLRSLDDPGAKARLPDNHVEADEKNPYQWKNLKPGKYVICLDPDYEDWSSHCVAGIPVTVSDGLTTLPVAVPSGSLDITVSFDGVPEPKQRYTDYLIFRVERIEEGGKANPYVRQWLWVKKEDGKLTGPLDYLEPGNYRIIAFIVDERFQMKDAGSGELRLDAATIKKGSAGVVINKKVEQNGAGQPTTAPETKSKDKKTSTKKSKGRSQ